MPVFEVQQAAVGARRAARELLQLVLLLLLPWLLLFPLLSVLLLLLLLSTHYWVLLTWLLPSLLLLLLTLLLLTLLLLTLLLLHVLLELARRGRHHARPHARPPAAVVVKCHIHTGAAAGEAPGREGADGEVRAGVIKTPCLTTRARRCRDWIRPACPMLRNDLCLGPKIA